MTQFWGREYSYVIIIIQKYFYENNKLCNAMVKINTFLVE